MEALDAAIAFMGTDDKPGTQSDLARAIGNDVRQSVVGMWKARKSVPAKYAPDIERVTGGRVRCEDLCPDVNWAVLRQSAKEAA